MKNIFMSILTLFLFAGTSLADEMVVAADSWTPFNADPESDKPGYMIEIAQKMFATKLCKIKVY